MILLSLLAAASPIEPGPYVMLIDVASRSEIAFAGRTEVITRSLVRVDLRRTADGWAQTQRVCDLRILSDSNARTEIPDSFLASLPEQTYPVQLIPQEGGGWSFIADPGPSEVGFDPSVTGGEVPTRRSDPGVLDPDRDGYPGVTVRLHTPVIGPVRIYIAQRAHSRYHGQVIDGEIRGQVEIVSMEQRTLGASFAPFAANPTIIPDPSGSRFALRPIEAEQDCAALREEWDGGFGSPDGA